MTGLIIRHRPGVKPTSACKIVRAERDSPKKRKAISWRSGTDGAAFIILHSQTPRTTSNRDTFRSFARDRFVKVRARLRAYKKILKNCFTSVSFPRLFCCERIVSIKKMMHNRYANLWECVETGQPGYEANGLRNVRQIAPSA
ncbi:hypothetical protein PUN28_008684 [Cardiocondyla obscurior]|uniref:Uncharacterized protein n=1 Tax=Cardiocondyla obscurior TaxID=286306 RepID=A0AAW2G0V6_9HYME